MSNTLEKEELDQLADWLLVKLMYERDMHLVAMDRILDIVDEFKDLYTKLKNNERK